MRLLKMRLPVVWPRKMQWQGTRPPETVPQRLPEPGMPLRPAHGRPCVRLSQGRASATDGTRGKDGAGQTVQSRKYPGTYDYLADDMQEHRRPRRRTSVSLFAAGGVTGSSGATAASVPTW